MSGIQDLISATKKHQDATDLQRGSFRASLNILQTKNATAMLERIGAAYAGALPADAPMPTREAFFLAMLEQVGKDLPEGAKSDVRVEEFVKAMLFPVKESAPDAEGEEGKGGRRKPSKGRRR